MDAILNAVSFDGASLILSVAVFVAVALAMFGAMAALRLRGDVKRRAAGIASPDDELVTGATVRNTSVKAAQRLLDYANKHYASLDDRNLKQLRRRLVQAGVFEPRAVAFFFLARAALAVGLGLATFIAVPILFPGADSNVWPLIGVAGLAGYLGPSLVLDRMISTRQREYRSGFPDFMDLLVVCADAGLAMEGALERVGRELSVSYPALSANIHMTNLEIRAGRTLTEALDHFGDRLGLEEVRSFATLIQQSNELGSSITDALRVYSDDMRHKRLSTAEEKAYALPAKLSVPLILCVFPVLFIVILLPVYVRFHLHLY